MRITFVLVKLFFPSCRRFQNDFILSLLLLLCCICVDFVIGHWLLSSGKSNTCVYLKTWRKDFERIWIESIWPRGKNLEFTWWRCHVHAVTIELKSLNMGLTNSNEPQSFLRIHQSLSYSRISQHFTEPEGSLPCSQDPSPSLSWAKLIQSVPSHTISLRPILILSSHPMDIVKLMYNPVALCDKSQGRKFNSRGSYRIFQFQPHYGPGVDSASNRNEYQEDSWGVKESRLACV
jgi:hypothetical protein